MAAEQVARCSTALVQTQLGLVRPRPWAGHCNATGKSKIALHALHTAAACNYWYYPAAVCCKRSFSAICGLSRMDGGHGWNRESILQTRLARLGLKGLDFESEPPHDSDPCTKTYIYYKRCALGKQNRSLEEDFLWVALRLRFWSLQHLVAED